METILKLESNWFSALFHFFIIFFADFWLSKNTSPPVREAQRCSRETPLALASFCPRATKWRGRSSCSWWNSTEGMKNMILPFYVYLIISYITFWHFRQLVGAGSSALAAFICQYIQRDQPSLLTNLPGRDSQPKLSLEELSKAFIDRKLSHPGNDRSRLVHQASLTV